MTLRFTEDVSIALDALSRAAAAADETETGEESAVAMRRVITALTEHQALDDEPLTLRFTEDEMRAFSNALDRADIEVEHEDPQGEEEEEDARNNRRDVDTAMGMWGRIRTELLDEPLRVGTVVDGALTCPNGHAGEIEHQEQQWERRSVRGIEDGVLKIGGDSRTLDDSGSGEVLFCRTCGVGFDFPADLPVDYV